jgi:hypothetical protein
MSDLNHSQYSEQRTRQTDFDKKYAQYSTQPPQQPPAMFAPPPAIPNTDQLKLLQ